MSATAEELWRVAETGDVEELDGIFLRGVDVNARSKHGMTALMRAAYHGHEQMVRALLRHGADPNVPRNDKFTALALAAFFGHTKTVRILIEHGAKTEVITRCGASARMWATARTFEEAARCIESHEPAPAPVAPAPIASVASAPVVRTLKEPPEIWDLVHEAPRGFNASSAFISRIRSMQASFAVQAAAVVMAIAAGVTGALLLRGSKAHNLPADTSASQTAVTNQVSAPSNTANTTTAQSVTEPALEAAEFSHHSEPALGTDKPLRKVTSLTRQTRSRSTPSDEEPKQSREVAAAPPATVASPQLEQRNSNKPSNTLSPQLISPAKSAAPKPKVIQWP